MYPFFLVNRKVVTAQARSRDRVACGAAVSAKREIIFKRKIFRVPHCAKSILVTFPGRKPLGPCIKYRKLAFRTGTPGPMTALRHRHVLDP